MEKQKPHYALEAIKAIAALRGEDAFTKAAIRGAAVMKVSLAEAVAVVLALEYRQFYKSMTTHANHRVWQDVYHAACPNGRMAYIKVTLQHDVAVIQFKEL
jgi:motility quorum-sensing regulator/GCU-specific mRNA interferase toxin